MIDIQQKQTNVCLLGASFDTGNLGVSALAESSIKIILNHWPDAKVTLFGAGSKDGEHHLTISGKDVYVKIVPLRFSKNIFLPYHFVQLTFYCLLTKLIPCKRFVSRLINHNPYFKIMYDSDVVVDITGGDSFSDIYGFKRFMIYGFLQKWLVTFMGKKLILLPQTYGPFNKKLAQKIARHILRKSSLIYSRDPGGVKYVQKLLKSINVNGKVRFIPDVAFVLDPRKPENMDIALLNENRREDSIVVGLNVSGLLFNGGYTRENMFALKSDYKKLIYSVIDLLMQNKKTHILLVPHVFALSGNVESDPDACMKIYDHIKNKHPGRIFIVKGNYNHNEIKYIIGQCDFFIGSRMHSCIAALSQSVPAVGLAYSKKFKGVYESLEIEDYVADIYVSENAEVLSIVKAAFDKRNHTRSHLKKVIPQIQREILNLFAAEDRLSSPDSKKQMCDVK